MKNEDSKETNNQKEQTEMLSNSENIFTPKEENRTLKELQNQIEQLSLNTKDKQDSP